MLIPVSGSFSRPDGGVLFGSGFESRVVRETFGPLAHGPENRETLAFYAHGSRRKVLFETARELGCNKSLSDTTKTM